MQVDSEIKRRVEEELQWEPSLNPNDIISVAVENGIVTLTGFVRSYDDKVQAEAAAKRIAGVVSVVNDLEVRIPGEDERPDPDIARDIIAMFRIRLRDAAEHIRVTVEDGWVTLEGEVEWNYQREAAENVATYMKGVKGVTNLIELHSSAEAAEIRRKVEAEIKHKIQKAFERSAELDANLITVETAGSTAILRGAVRSWAEREEAERIAWSAPGVTRVENRIIVAASD